MVAALPQARAVFRDANIFTGGQRALGGTYLPLLGDCFPGRSTFGWHDTLTPFISQVWRSAGRSTGLSRIYVSPRKRGSDSFPHPYPTLASSRKKRGTEHRMGLHSFGPPGLTPIAGHSSRQKSNHRNRVAFTSGFPPGVMIWNEPTNPRLAPVKSLATVS